jgi:hypothetical protein
MSMPRKTLATLLTATALCLGAATARAEGGAQRGQVSVKGPTVKVIVAGPVDIHAYSGFSGASIYAALAITGTEADCRAQAVRDETPVRADNILDFQVHAGEVACLATTTNRPFELLWHAQKAAPTMDPVMIAKTR